MNFLYANIIGLLGVMIYSFYKEGLSFISIVHGLFMYIYLNISAFFSIFMNIGNIGKNSYSLWFVVAFVMLTIYAYLIYNYLQKEYFSLPYWIVFVILWIYLGIKHTEFIAI